MPSKLAGSCQIETPKASHIPAQADGLGLINQSNLER